MDFLGKHYNNVDNIKDLYYNLLYFTYKINFDLIKNTNLDSDLGWGCTIRSTQMMLSNILLYKKFNNNILKNEDYYYILYLFKDNYESLFSIYNFVKYYSLFNKKAGDWIGPFTACTILENFYIDLYNKFDIIYIHNLCEKNNIYKYSEENKSYLISISIKLGISEIDEKYYDDIIFFIKNKNFKGIIGGHDSSSYYFVGITDDLKLLYLDPHTPSLHNNNICDDNDFHTNNVMYLEIDKLSPSMSFCFYFKNFKSLEEFYISIDKNNILNIIEKNNIDKITIQEDDDWEVIGL